jgi:hypothetical protein
MRNIHNKPFVSGVATPPLSFSSTTKKSKESKSFSKDERDENDDQPKEGIEDLHLPSVA